MRASSWRSPTKRGHRLRASSRRSAPKSPRSVRSSSTQARAASTSGPRWSRRCAERARAHWASSTLCAFTHQPSHFVRLGFTIVPHMWVPEKIAHDCVGCAQFRQCGQYAVTLPLRAGVAASARAAGAALRRPVAPPRAQRRAAAAHPDPGMTATPRAGMIDVDGACRRPGDFARQASRCGIKRQASGLDLALIVSDGRRRPPPSSRRTRRRRRRSSSRRRNLAASGGQARAIVVNSGCANACTGSDGMATRRSDGRTPRRARRRAIRGGAGRVDRRHRRQARHGRRSSAASRRRQRRCRATAAPLPRAQS